MDRRRALTDTNQLELQTLYNVATHIVQLLHVENMQLAEDYGLEQEFQTLLTQALALRKIILYRQED